MIDLSDSPQHMEEYEMDEDTENEDEEAQVKRICLETMPSSQNNSILNKSMSGDDATTCPICFDSWTTDGPHRIICLKCGHVFGLSCIEKWCETTKKCPTCQSSIRRNDIRNLYIRSLRPLDTSEKQAFEKQIAEKDGEISRLKMDLGIYKLESCHYLQERDEKIAFLQSENERLKRELMTISAQNQSLRNSNLPTASASTAGQFSTPSALRTSVAPASQPFRMVKKLELGPDAKCRVLACCKDLDAIAASHKTFSAYGTKYAVRRINFHDLKLSDSIPIHNDTIYDMCFKPGEPLLLTASNDKTMKLTAVCDKSIVQTFDLDSMARSCCWHPTDSNYCFVGLGNGSILSYDIRKPDEFVHKYDGMAYCPLISVQFVSPSLSNSQNQKSDRLTGLLCNSLNTSFFFELSESGHLISKQNVAVEGKLLPCHYDQASGYGVIGQRPFKDQKQMKHIVLQLKKEPGRIVVDQVQQFCGGIKSDNLTRSKVFLNPASFDSQPYVFAPDESSQSIIVHDVEGRKLKQRLVVGTQDTIMDIDLMTANQDSMQVAALTEKSVFFFQNKFL